MAAMHGTYLVINLCVSHADEVKPAKAEVELITKNMASQFC